MFPQSCAEVHIHKVDEHLLIKATRLPPCCNAYKTAGCDAILRQRHMMTHIIHMTYLTAGIESSGIIIRIGLFLLIIRFIILNRIRAYHSSLWIP